MSIKHVQGKYVKLTKMYNCVFTANLYIFPITWVPLINALFTRDTQDNYKYVPPIWLDSVGSVHWVLLYPFILHAPTRWPTWAGKQVWWGIGGTKTMPWEMSRRCWHAEAMRERKCQETSAGRNCERYWPEENERETWQEILDRCLSPKAEFGSKPLVPFMWYWLNKYNMRLFKLFPGPLASPLPLAHTC